MLKPNSLGVPDEFRFAKLPVDCCSTRERLGPQNSQRSRQRIRKAKPKGCCYLQACSARLAVQRLQRLRIAVERQLPVMASVGCDLATSLTSAPNKACRTCAA
eukprot:3703166-Rhodomonas_salina.2